MLLLTEMMHEAGAHGELQAMTAEALVADGKVHAGKVGGVGVRGEGCSVC